MQEKGTQSYIVQRSKSSKKKKRSLANLCKITFTLFECHRSTAKSTDFYFFLLSLQSS